MKKAFEKMSTSIINFRKGFSDVIYDEDFLTVLPKKIIGKDVPHAHSFKKWMSSSDANNGGTSFCSFSANNSLVFKGRVVFDEEIAQRMHTRSGFCALRGSLKDTLDLRDYEGLELYMKSNTPVLVTLNMGCESYFDSDIFQFHFHVHDTWRKYHIPFHKFILTTQGMESLQQKENDSLRCQSFGFLIRSPNVPFELEVEEMTAIFDLQERYIPKLEKPRFAVPERAPDFELVEDAIVTENLQHTEGQTKNSNSAIQSDGESLNTSNTTK